MVDEFAGFGLRGYRSFGGSSIERVGPFGKVHLVVGQNNVGKSNLIRFLYKALPVTRAGSNFAYTDMFTETRDAPDDWVVQQPRFLSCALRVTGAIREKLRIDHSDWSPGDGSASLLTLLNARPFRRDPEEEVVWFDFELRFDSPSTTTGLRPINEQFQAALQEVDHVDMPAVLNRAASQTPRGASSSAYDNFAAVVEDLAPWQYLPDVRYVEAHRQVKGRSSAGDGTNIYDPLGNGIGLIDDLAKLQNPTMEMGMDNYRTSKLRFDELQQFVRVVLADAEASIAIPEDKKTIHVTLHNNPKELGSLGTGIGELIILAAATTLQNDALVCIEEPEVHLHPTLQRELIRYLANNTTNRYIITTHSAALLDSELASISHVTKTDDWSSIDSVLATRGHVTAVADLGNRASDLLQANFVVWVEGPSDRIYVRHWLTTFAPYLAEGIHYSIMFYGGALLSHLNADDQDVSEFIQLAKINRHFAILVDSDMANADAPLNGTKLRVLAEVRNAEGLAWVTAGYTIENYIDYALLERVLEKVHSGRRYKIPSGQWISPLGGRFDGSNASPDKLRVAREIASMQPDKSRWSDHLRASVVELVARICKANGVRNTM